VLLSLCTNEQQHWDGKPIVTQLVKVMLENRMFKIVLSITQKNSASTTNCSYSSAIGATSTVTK